MDEFTSKLLTLLDLIEINHEDKDKVHMLCQQRFDIAKDAGYRVEFEHFEVSGRLQ
ncbi:hypothetical protein LCGC14_1538770 [marine sediment metagenome]|uniref:Uncharacterized protein n=1 Tax=marine sediment metagenome TaxID=412755 RepID=A0A0F9LUG9_9ZZZZ